MTPRVPNDIAVSSMSNVTTLLSFFTSAGFTTTQPCARAGARPTNATPSLCSSLASSLQLDLLPGDDDVLDGTREARDDLPAKGWRNTGAARVPEPSHETTTALLRKTSRTASSLQ